MFDLVSWLSYVSFKLYEMLFVKLKIFIESSVVFYQFFQSLGAGCKTGQYKHRFPALII